MKIIFKHSYKCPISRAAKREMDDYLEEKPENIEYEYVDVFEDRPRSNDIEQKYNITHESPQVIVLDDNDKVTWNASHRSITKDAIIKAIAGE